MDLLLCCSRLLNCSRVVCGRIMPYSFVAIFSNSRIKTDYSRKLILHSVLIATTSHLCV